jgi:hypothetical protein
MKFMITKDISMRCIVKIICLLKTIEVNHKTELKLKFRNNSGLYSG